MILIDEKKYKELLGFMESNNDYNIKNGIGALGKYQFMPSTLNALQSLYNLPAWQNANYFLSNPALQEQYETYLIKDTLNFIRANKLEKHFGLNIQGSKRFKTIKASLNVYGMLAGAHLAGVTALKEFFSTGNDPNDGFTSLTDYMALFSSKISNLQNSIPLLLAFIPAIVLYYT